MPLPVTIHDQEQPKDEIVRRNGMTEMYGCTTVFAVSAFGIAPNNGTPWYQSCTAKALGSGALSIDEVAANRVYQCPK